MTDVCRFKMGKRKSWEDQNLISETACLWGAGKSFVARGKSVQTWIWTEFNFFLSLSPTVSLIFVRANNLFPSFTPQNVSNLHTPVQDVHKLNLGLNSIRKSALVKPTTYKVSWLWLISLWSRFISLRSDSDSGPYVNCGQQLQAAFLKDVKDHADRGGTQPGAWTPELTASFICAAAAQADTKIRWPSGLCGCFH